jgi:hypothetical protein
MRSSWGRRALFRAPAPHAEYLTTLRARTPWTSLRAHAKACCPSLCFRVACGLAWLSPPPSFLAAPLLLSHCARVARRQQDRRCSHNPRALPSSWAQVWAPAGWASPETLGSPYRPDSASHLYTAACACREYRKIKRPFLPTARLLCCPPYTAGDHTQARQRSAARPPSRPPAV